MTGVVRGSFEKKRILKKNNDLKKNSIFVAFVNPEKTHMGSKKT